MNLRTAAGVILLLSGSPAMAQVLDLPSAFGNEAGCKAMKAGEQASGEAIIVRPDSLQANGLSCEFVEVLHSKDGAAVVTSLCQSEGMYQIIPFVVSSPDEENDTRLVFREAGDLWAEVGPCN